MVEQISPRFYQVRAPTGGIEEHFCLLPYQDRSSYSDIDPELAITNATQDESLPLPQAQSGESIRRSERHHCTPDRFKLSWT